MADQNKVDLNCECIFITLLSDIGAVWITETRFVEICLHNSLTRIVFDVRGSLGVHWLEVEVCLWQLLCWHLNCKFVNTCTGLFCGLHLVSEFLAVEEPNKKLPGMRGTCTRWYPPVFPRVAVKPNHVFNIPSLVTNREHTKWVLSEMDDSVGWHMSCWRHVCWPILVTCCLNIIWWHLICGRILFVAFVGLRWWHSFCTRGLLTPDLLLCGHVWHSFCTRRLLTPGLLLCGPACFRWRVFSANGGYRTCCCRLYTRMTTWTRSPGPSAPLGPCCVLIGWLHLWRKRWRGCYRPR